MKRGTKWGDRKNRYKDMGEFAPSFLVPLIKNEKWHARHRRRLKFAIENIDRLKKFCDYYKITFTIPDDLPNKHHFYFQDKITKVVYHWYPSSAKFVEEPFWAYGMHVHDHLQVMNILMIERKKRFGRYDPNKV